MLPTLVDFAARANHHSLHSTVTTPAIAAINALLGGGWQRGDAFWYPAASGWMDWHTNYKHPGPRIYLVWCAEGGKSCFIFSPDGKNMVRKMEPAGWSVNIFMVGDQRQPFWHALNSGGTDRISVGFRRG